MRIRTLLVPFSLLILTLPPANVATLQPSGTKSETIYYKTSPLGDLTSGSVEVLLRVGGSGESVMIVDRVYMADAGSVSPLLGSPPPSRVESFYGHVILYWDGVQLTPEVEIRYTAQTGSPPPLQVNLTILVNGEPASLIEFNGDYFLEINRGDSLNLTFTLSNVRHPVRTSVGEGRPPLVYTLQVGLPKSHFSEPTGSPEPSMTLPTTDDWVLSWTGVLWDEPAVVSLSAKVRPTATEGFIELPAVTVQASLDADTIAEQLREAVESYRDALEALKEMNETLSDAVSGMEAMANWLGEGRARVLKASDGLLKLADALESASEAASAASEAAEGAARSVEHTVSEAQRALAFLDSVEKSLEEFYESYENLTQALHELLEQMGISFNLTPPVGALPPLVLESIRSQLTAAIARGQSAADMLHGLAYAMENASASAEVAAEQARVAADELESLGHALAMAEYAARSGIESAQAGLAQLEERIAEAERELERAMLRAELASYYEPLTGVCELNEGEHALLVAKPGLTELEGQWALESLSLASNSSTRILGVAIPLPCSQGPPKVELMQEGSWRECGINELASVGVLYFPDSCAVYIRTDANVTDGRVNLAIGGMPLRLLLSEAVERDALLDPSIGLELETDSRVVIKLGLPTLSVDMPVRREEEPSQAQTPPPPEEAASGWRGLYLISAVIAAMCTVALYRVHRQRSEEKAALLARISEMAAQLDALESELMERLGEVAGEK